jgi:hypothetical protein
MIPEQQEVQPVTARQLWYIRRSDVDSIHEDRLPNAEKLAVLSFSQQ